MTIYSNPMQIYLAALCYFVVSAGSCLAVFSKKIKDTTLERMAHGCVCITAAGTGCRIVYQGWISEGGLYFAAALAVLVLVLVGKHLKATPTALPRDKTSPAPLSPMPHDPR